MNRYTMNEIKAAIEAILTSSIPLDSWPYTDHFEAKYAQFMGRLGAERSRNHFWCCCLSVRKRGRAGPLGGIGGTA